MLSTTITTKLGRLGCCHAPLASVAAAREMAIALRVIMSRILWLYSRA
jgi:hypothetical protein